MSLVFDQLNSGACKTYLIACSETGEAMLIDPLLEHVERYLADVRRRGLRLRFVVDTHLHADHLSAGAAIKELAGVPYAMHRASPSGCVDLRIEDGQQLTVGEIPVRFQHTPGHTQDSLTLVLPDRVLTGDFLFLGEGGAGRTDLPGGDPGAHWEALHRLEGLPDSLLVFPGHDYRGQTSSTLGEERRRNQRLAPRTRDEYVAWLGSMQFGAAGWMNDVLRANAACTRDARAVAVPTDARTCEAVPAAEGVERISIDDLRRELDTVALLDVRQPDEFIGPLGHIRGAVNVPLAELPARLAELEPLRQKRIVATCKAGARSTTAAALLHAHGFDVRVLDGGMTAWNERRMPVEREEDPSWKSSGNAVPGTSPGR